VREFVAAEQARLDAFASAGGTEDAMALRLAMQETMTQRVGIFCAGEERARAVSELQALLERSRRIGLRSAAPGPNPELVTAYRVQKMLKVALCMAHGAAMRTESRGAHFREDFPRRDDAQWLQRTLATWPAAGDLLPTLNYEPLDVQAMELPPGWRGYGARDYIDHPDTAARTAEVAAIRQRLQDAPRAEVQQALMPFHEWLPPPLRGPNERIDEPLAQRSA
jgi:fumarate reductase flavoprotein subunit